jgi:hypothetical protein
LVANFVTAKNAFTAELIRTIICRFAAGGVDEASIFLGAGGSHPAQWHENRHHCLRAPSAEELPDDAESHCPDLITGPRSRYSASNASPGR